MDMIVSAQGNIITKQEIFHAFQRYCDEMSLGKLSEQAVTRRLKQHVTGLTDKKVRINGENTMVWEDIDLKENRSHLVGANHITTTVNSPKLNFSENEEKWEQTENIQGESTWLDENREAGK